MRKSLMCCIFLGAIIGVFFCYGSSCSIFQPKDEIPVNWKKIQIGRVCSLVVPKEFVSQNEHYLKAVQLNNSAEALNAEGFRVLEDVEFEEAKLWKDNSLSEFPKEILTLGKGENSDDIFSIVIGVVPVKFSRDEQSFSQILNKELDNYIRIQTEMSKNYTEEKNRITVRYFVPCVRKINGESMIHGGTLHIFNSLEYQGASSTVTDIFVVPGKTKDLCIHIHYSIGSENPSINEVERIIDSIDVRDFYQSQYK